MLGVIEMQIKKNPCGQGVSTCVNVVTSEGAPTISSILKTDHRSDILRPAPDISRGSHYISSCLQQHLSLWTCASFCETQITWWWWWWWWWWCFWASIFFLWCV